MPPDHARLQDLISRCGIMDAHTHSDRYEGVRRDKMIRSVEKRRILTLSSSTDPLSTKSSFALHERCPWILTSAGIHPWNAGLYTPADVMAHEDLYRDAHQISEIGMDGIWAPEEATEKRQAELLEQQLFLAEKYAKPVTVHTKDAENQVLDLLKRYSLPSILIHWFDGSDSQLSAFLDRGCLFTISPAVISDHRAREIIGKIPLQRLMPETDNPPTWPWLFSKPPAADQIFKVLKAASGILNLGIEELTEAFRETLRTFFMVSR